MSAVKKNYIVETIRKAQLSELLAKGKRLDGRSLEQYRELKIETQLIEKANASARVTLGNTQVIAGVKIATGTPFPDTPDKGLLIVTAEVLPLSSPYAEAGPPDEDAIELARVVDRGIRESEMVDLTELCIVAGKVVVTIFVDVSILNVDGNLFDATSFAVVSALKTAKMPKYVPDGDKAKATGETIPVPVKRVPVSVTMARIGNVLIVDPSIEEEAVMDARITLTTDDDGNICAGQKGNPSTFTPAQVMAAAELSTRKGKEIRKQIVGAAK
ncbi:MAG: exosome complex protein Rrp42 [Thaumarchaeota archaeon]|nr:exosome complex protein Rrp42 [Nitrososphaerota archaeon]